MSTVLCQNHTETATTTLQLKLAAQPPESRGNLATELAQPKTHREFGNWGFEFPQTRPKTDWAALKPSFSSLSAKSLELCTENLGSETGCEIIADGDYFSFASPAPIKSKSSDSVREEIEIGIGAAGSGDRWKQITRFPKNPNHNFPPPLTSSLQVRRHSDGGRLIMEAVEAPFRNSYLQADRSEGRLRLCFLTAEATAPFAGDEDEVVEEIEGEAAAEEESKSEIKSNSAEEESESELEFDESEMKSNSEMEKFQWMSRCKEGGRHGNKWKPAVWVAIS